MSGSPNLVRQLCKILFQWSPLWLATTATTTALGLAYITMVKEDVWVASQAMIVRDEMGGTLNRQGRFDNKESLKGALDTILEIARNPQVVQHALQSQQTSDSAAISERMINDFIREQLTVRSPKGSEFGTTEIFYIDVRHMEKPQAVALNQAICTALEKRLQEIRMSRYEGIERELEYALDIAKEQRSVSTEQLKKIESQAGENLLDLRSLTDSLSAGGTSKAILDQLSSERRQVEVQKRQQQEDLRFLQTLEDDPARVLVAPSTVLNSQPGLKRMCEGLVDSQLQELQLSGRYTAAHPAVQAAKISAESIRQQLGSELKLARAALETEIYVSEQRIVLLDEQIKQSQQRITELADIRADYANILGEVRNRSVIVEQIEKDLAIAEANRRAAGQTSLVARIDSPVLSDKPIGPGNTTLLLASIVAGFLSGIGLILLFAPIDLGIKHGRRWSDHIYAATQSMTQSSERRETTYSMASELKSMNTVPSAVQPQTFAPLTTPPATAATPSALTHDHTAAHYEPADAITSNTAAPIATATRLDPSRQPFSALASDVDPPAAIIRAIQAANLSDVPIKLESTEKLRDTKAMPIKSKNNAAPITLQDSNSATAPAAALASERRTRVRQQPAAIFSTNSEPTTIGFTNSDKVAT
jgi:uncharacterized protein involved in exopolysaccharide biosynthesis